MDTQIEHKKRFTPKQIYGGVGVVLLIVLILYLFFRDTSSSMTVEKNRITIATIKEGEFNDYIRVIGQVLPSRMIYLDAIEGGRVEERLFEEAAMVKKGDAILRLSNPLLNIGIMQSEADLAYQENELRNTRISMEQERLALKQERIGMHKEFLTKKRRYEQYRRLLEEQLIAREDYRLATEEYEAAREQLLILDERIRQDSLFRLTQIASLDENILNMKRSLTLVRERTCRFASIMSSSSSAYFLSCVALPEQYIHILCISAVVPKHIFLVSHACRIKNATLCATPSTIPTFWFCFCFSKL